MVFITLHTGNCSPAQQAMLGHAGHMPGGRFGQLATHRTTFDWYILQMILPMPFMPPARPS
ncbi:MAG: hypothetical protein NVSMB6_32400 [Burkholderiaceae bacterium]